MVVFIEVLAPHATSRPKCARKIKLAFTRGKDHAANSPIRWKHILRPPTRAVIRRRLPGHFDARELRPSPRGLSIPVVFGWRRPGWHNLRAKGRRMRYAASIVATAVAL